VPGKLSKSRRRVSYAEDLEILKELLAISKRRGVTLTAVLHEATTALVQKSERKQKGKQ
jgi:hypothetical protein